MNFKPGDFFLGIVDFLGVLVPGAVLVYLEDDVLCNTFGISPLHEHWLVLAAAAYLFGHLLLALTESFNWLGGCVLRVFRPISKTQRDTVNLGKASLPLLGTAAGTDHDTNPGTAFHAALSFLRLKDANAAAEIDRHMAGYKLLRNLVGVFLIDLVVSLFGGHKCCHRLTADIVLAVLFFLAFLRMLQWANLLVFQYCILINEHKTDEHKPGSSSSSTPSH